MSQGPPWEHGFKPHKVCLPVLGPKITEKSASQTLTISKTHTMAAPGGIYFTVPGTVKLMQGDLYHKITVAPSKLVTEDWGLQDARGNKVTKNRQHNTVEEALVAARKRVNELVEEGFEVVENAD